MSTTQGQYWDPKAQDSGYGFQGSSQPPPPPGYVGSSNPPPPPGYQGSGNPPPPPPGYENVQNRPTGGARSYNQAKMERTKQMMGKWMSMVPCMHMCWAWFCFIMNCTIPGIGTIIAAFIVLCPCCSKHPTCGDRIRVMCINFWFGILQIITSVIIFGFIWTAYWGWFMVVVSYMNYHAHPNEDEGLREEFGGQRAAGFGNQNQRAANM